MMYGFASVSVVVEEDEEVEGAPSREGVVAVML